MDCKIKDNLLLAYDQAIAMHYQAITKSDSAKPLSSENKAEAKSKVECAQLELYAHLAQHGCLASESPESNLS